MHFFVDEILENEEIKACLSDHDPLAAKGREIAQEMARTGVRAKLEPGMLPIYVLAYLADDVLKKNSARGIPRQITVDTLKDVNVWLGNYSLQYGKPGLAEFAWLSNHYLGKLFCLGRLQFIAVNAPADVPAGQFALETHIPQGKPLALDACMASFAQAKDFFAKYFPEKPAEYFICHSWLLCPNLAKVLNKESNIVRFMQLWDQYPCKPDQSAQAMQRVFGFGFQAAELPNAPETTSLQKQMKAYLLGGGDLSACAGYRKI